MLTSAAAALRAERFLEQRLGQFQAAAAAAHAGIRFGELFDDALLLVGRDRSRAGDFQRHLLDLLGIELRHQVARLLLGQRHQEDGGIVNVGHDVPDAGASEEKLMALRPARNPAARNIGAKRVAA